MTGRDSAETSGYFPSYSALARSAGTRTFWAKSFARVDDLDLDRAGGAGAFPDRPRPRPATSWPTSTAQHTTSTPHSSRIQRTAIDVSSPPE